MTIRLSNNSTPSNLYVGNQSVDRVYLGATQVWPVTNEGGYPVAAEMDMIAMRHMTFNPMSLGSFDSVQLLSQPSNGRAVLQDNSTIVVNMDGSQQEASISTLIAHPLTSKISSVEL